jgi:hypothetical protein
LRSAYPAEQPSWMSIAAWGGMFRVWNKIVTLQMDVREGIEEHQRGLRTAYSSVRAPLRSGGGGMFRVWNEIEALQIEVGVGIE